MADPTTGRPAATTREADADDSVAAGRALAAALAGRDFRGLAELLAGDAAFRYLVPRGPGELHGPADIVARFTAWYGDADPLEVREALVDRLADRTSVRLRLLAGKPDGPRLISQQMFLDTDRDGRIERLDLLCSGFRPIETAPDSPASHVFDAGTMGCADGLADEFRRRIAAVPPGEALAVVARDPAAKEDLPPLARMLGHTVRSVEATAGGTTTFTIERAR